LTLKPNAKNKNIFLYVLIAIVSLIFQKKFKNHFIFKIQFRTLICHTFGIFLVLESDDVELKFLWSISTLVGHVLYEGRQKIHYFMSSTFMQVGPKGAL